jgi:uncharacterized membrane protein YukC
MKILNEDTDARIKGVSVYFTLEEAKQCFDFLEALISDTTMHHLHVNCIDDSDTVTIAIYNPKNLVGFDDRSKKLILEGV